MSLCTICEELDVSRKDEVQLGKYVEIAKRAESGCKLCNFFVDTLNVSSQWSYKLDELLVKFIVLKDLRLQVRAPESINERSYSYDDLKFDVCVRIDYSGTPTSESDLIHVIPADPRDERCFKQLESWILECSGHENCSIPTPVSLPKRIIEIPEDTGIKPKFVLSGEKIGSYLALAYLPGDEEITETSRPVIGEDIDLQTLPKSFADAVEVTRRLGFKYLFISTLCIPEAEWVEESFKFAHIYSNATLLLSATTSISANSGILTQDRSKFYSPPVGANKDKYLRQNLFRWRAEVEGSALARESWAVQARILAPRVVHFTKRQMIWECAQNFSFEAGGVEDKSWGSMQVRQTYRKELVQRFITEGLRRSTSRPEQDSRGDNAVDEIAKQARRFEAWHTVVDHLSNTSTKSLEDKLLLLAPLAKLFDDDSLGGYLSGIWSRNIGVGLAWSRVYAMLTTAPTYRAPSWSPLSVDGEVSGLFMNWSPTILQDQAANPTWIEKYGLKLLETNVLLADPENPYGQVKEGSHIVVEGACIAFKALMTHIQNEDSEEESIFSANPVLDTSWIFDCACCTNLKVSDDERAAKNEEFNKEMDRHVLMIVGGDGWRTKESPVDILILHEVEGKGGGEEEVGRFRRVGLMRMQLEMRVDGSYDEGAVNREFEGCGWERRVLRLL